MAEKRPVSLQNDSEPSGPIFMPRAPPPHTCSSSNDSIFMPPGRPVPPVQLLLPLVAGHEDLLGVNDDNSVTNVSSRRVGGLVLAQQDFGALGRHAAETQAIGIDHDGTSSPDFAVSADLGTKSSALLSAEARRRPPPSRWSRREQQRRACAAWGRHRPAPAPAQGCTANVAAASDSMGGAGGSEVRSRRGELTAARGRGDSWAPFGAISSRVVSCEMLLQNATPTARR